jgi:hypothetical protein
MKIGLDLHGIINTHPVFFAELSKLFVEAGHEIHVLTGSHLVDSKIPEELEKYGIKYTHLFSIADYHRENKTNGMWYDTNGDPWVTDEEWDRTKSEYCKRHDISFCIDDTARYANHFETPFGYMSIQMNKYKPNKYLGLIINMFEARRRRTTAPTIQKPQTFWDKFNNKIEWFFSPKWKCGKFRE